MRSATIDATIDMCRTRDADGFGSIDQKAGYGIATQLIDQDSAPRLIGAGLLWRSFSDMLAQTCESRHPDFHNRRQVICTDDA